MDNEQSEHAGKPLERRIGLRDIAAELGISHVTVSRALRNLPNVSKATRARVEAKADEMGYVPDPLLATLSRYSKNHGAKIIQAELAWINTWSPPESLRQYQEFELYWQGALENARRMGYRLVAFDLVNIPLQRVRSILKARNIQGILLPPLGNVLTELNGFDWSDFAVVRFGEAISQPVAHFVSSSQMENMMTAFERIHQLGYQRIGCVCEYHRRRLFSSGFEWVQKELPSAQRIPLFCANHSDSLQARERQLDTWLKQNRPDAIITEKTETLHMLQRLGYRIPEDIGLATSSVHDTEIDAGMDQHPYEIGWAATRMLTSLIAERSFGLPRFRSKLLIEGSWVDGLMLPDRGGLVSR